MARLTDDTKQKILADFHAGMTRRGISRKYEISPATVNKLCNGIEPKNVDKVIALSRIKTELAEQSVHEVNAVNTAVDERTKHVLFFNSAAIRNVKEAMDEPCNNQHEFKARAETIAKGRETVLGKTPDTAIQINNENSSKHPSLNVILNK